MNICIIGQGNVACNLFHAFQSVPVSVSMCSSREHLEQLPSADIYIYAVRDEALAQVIAQVSELAQTALHYLSAALHVHTSGTMLLSVFPDSLERVGVLYFFQTFSKSCLIDDFSTIPTFIETRRSEDLSFLMSFAKLLVNDVYPTSSFDRERLHIAGVFANNFSNHMFAIAKDLLSQTSIPFSALLPLIDKTAQKVHSLSPRDAQTGPAVRRDEHVIQHHLDLLPTDDLRALYSLISRLIQSANSDK